MHKALPIDYVISEILYLCYQTFSGSNQQLIVLPKASSTLPKSCIWPAASQAIRPSHTASDPSPTWFQTAEFLLTQLHLVALPMRNKEQHNQNKGKQHVMPNWREITHTMMQRPNSNEPWLYSTGPFVIVCVKYTRGKMFTFFYCISSVPCCDGSSE